VNVLVPLGTRPEIIKGAPIVRALRGAGVVVRVVATGQHSDPALSDAFFRDLGIEPDERWDLPADEAERIGALMTLAYQGLERTRPDLVLVIGDTHTVSVFALAARRHLVPVVHVEAGLRSFNETSLEELNRKVVMSGASLHFAPTDLAARFLLREGVAPERIHVVGNPVLDTLRGWGVEPRSVDAREGILVTAHRATNVDDPDRLCAIVEIVERLADDIAPVTFPLQPRTRSRLQAAGWLSRLHAHPRVRLLDPVPHRVMLDLVAGSRVVVTDSGGLQEEGAWLGVPVVVLRHSTPRWEGVAAGTSVLVGLDVDLAIDVARELCSPDAQARAADAPCPYGDGDTAARIVDVLIDPSTRAVLDLRAPDFVGKPVPS
jgi:UDP-N-acetylglucosamine 2-epimerase (non-hydrolysing)